MASKKDPAAGGGAGDAFQNIAGMSFEQALAELEDIVRRLEKGEIDLEAAIGAYERGAALRRHCDAKLRQAEEKVSKITVGSDGTPDAEPFDPGNGSAG